MCASRKVAVEQEMVVRSEDAQLECEEDEEGEAQPPHSLRDPKASSLAEVEEHAHAIQVMVLAYTGMPGTKFIDDRQQCENSLLVLVFDHCWVRSDQGGDAHQDDLRPLGAKGRCVP